MNGLKIDFIESCINLIHSKEDLNDEKALYKHNENLGKVRQIIRVLKEDINLDRSFLVEVLNNPNEVVKIQASYALLFELKFEKIKAISTLKQIKRNSTNELYRFQSDLMLRKHEGYFYSKFLIISLYFTLLLILFFALYYNLIKKNHTGPMDSWAAIILGIDIFIYILIIIITRVKRITLFDGTDKTIKFSMPLVWFAKACRIIKKIK